MTEISPQTVKELREKTGAGMMECKKALLESHGNPDQALEYLRKRGIAMAGKRSGRETKEGEISAYIHAGGKIGVLVEVNCETDFVAKTDEFRDLTKNLSMHIAAANPRFLRREDIPQAVLAKEKEIFMEQAKTSGKPEKAWESIVSGKLKKFVTEVCLLEQSYVRDPDKTITQLLQEIIAKVGENITIRRFIRFELGGEI